MQGVTVDTVVNSGPGLVFITYPEVVLKLPGGSIWAIIFFFMLVVRITPLLPRVLQGIYSTDTPLTDDCVTKTLLMWGIQYNLDQL